MPMSRRLAEQMGVKKQKTRKPKPKPKPKKKAKIDEAASCVACGGTGESSSGGRCLPCEGIGRLVKKWGWQTG